MKRVKSIIHFKSVFLMFVLIAIQFMLPQGLYASNNIGSINSDFPPKNPSTQDCGCINNTDNSSIQPPLNASDNFDFIPVNSDYVANKIATDNNFSLTVDLANQLGYIKCVGRWIVVDKMRNNTYFVGLRTVPDETDFVYVISYEDEDEFKSTTIPAIIHATKITQNKTVLTLRNIFGGINYTISKINDYTTTVNVSFFDDNSVPHHSCDYWKCVSQCFVDLIAGPYGIIFAALCADVCYYLCFTTPNPYTCAACAACVGLFFAIPAVYCLAACGIDPCSYGHICYPGTTQWFSCCFCGADGYCYGRQWYVCSDDGLSWILYQVSCPTGYVCDGTYNCIIKPIIPPPQPPRPKKLFLIHGLTALPPVLKDKVGDDSIIKAYYGGGEVDKNIFYFPYTWLFTSQLSDVAYDLKSYIQQRCTSDDKIDIIVHSLGGLIVAYFIKNYYSQIPADNRPTIEYIISCGSPLRGIYAASNQPLLEIPALYLGAGGLLRWVLYSGNSQIPPSSDPNMYIEIPGPFTQGEIDKAPIAAQQYGIKWYEIMGHAGSYIYGTSMPALNGQWGDGSVPVRSCIVEGTVANYLLEGYNHGRTVDTPTIRGILGLEGGILPPVYSGQGTEAKIVSQQIGVQGTPLQFDGTNSLVPEERTIVSYKWDFGDHTLALGASPTHKYEIPGIYQVTLTIMDNTGVEDSSTTLVDIKSSIENSMLIITGDREILEGEEDDFFISGTSSDVNWDFGDGTEPEITISPSVSHTFSAAGRYVVKATTINSAGNMDEARMEVMVNNVAPIITMDTSFNIFDSQNLTITPFITDPGVAGESFNYLWQFAGNNYSFKNLNVDLDRIGVFDGNLTVLDSNGGMDIRYFNVSVIDDDTDPPVIAQISFPQVVLDGASGVCIDVCAMDVSGIGELMVQLCGETYSGLPINGVYRVILPNPVVLGTFSFRIIVRDGDNDRPGDSEGITNNYVFEVMDDDINAPVITWTYNGDYTDGNPGTIMVIAYDPANPGDDTGLLVDPSGMYQLANIINMPQSFFFIATDNDNEPNGIQPDDSLSANITIPAITLSDDDTTGPEILININGFYLNPSGGVDVKFEIIATDPESGIDFSSIDIVALNQHFTSLGSFTATVQVLITYTITAHIKNADLDRGSIDQELAIATLDVNVTGDLLKTLILAGIEDLSILVENSNDISWRSPGANRKNTIETKLEDLVALINSNQYNGSYCKLLHDLKPKLTGLKHDEFGATWGSGTSNTPWVVDVPLQGDFESTINALLHALRWLAGGDPNPIGRLLASAL